MVTRVPSRLLLMLSVIAAALGAVASIPSCRSAKPIPAAPAAAEIAFRDVAQHAGINFSRVNCAFGKRWIPETMGGGGGFIDYDRDGFMDIVLVNGDWYAGHPLPGPRPTLKLYHNNRNGKFTDVTAQMGLEVSIQGMGAAVGDYDDDGFDDLFITGVAQCRLFHNERGNRFVDVSAQSGIRDPGWSTSAAWVDYDGDGKLDLFVCNYVKWSPETDVFCGVKIKTYCEPSVFSGDSCRLFHNEGRGRFKDVSQRASLLTDQSKALGVCVLDFDGDGRTDIFVANDLMPNALYRNNGDGTFRNIGLESGMAVGETGRARAGMGVDSADCEGRGAQTIAIGNFTNEGLALYDLSGSPPYIDRSMQAGTNMATVPYVTFSVLFADFDNDCLPDLFVTNGHIEDTISVTHRGQTYAQPSQVFRNRGNSMFTEASAEAGPAVTTPLVGRGAARGDFDNDGKVDLLLMPNFGPCRLLHNETATANHWITFKLKGEKSNRNGYGAKITVESDGRRLTGLARSGSGYLAANDPRVVFGLGRASRAGRITVRWSSGLEESWGPFPADRIVTLKEGSGTLH